MSNSRVIQVTNVAPTATKDQMKTLFGYIGRIEEIKLYPAEDSPLPVASRVCFVKYDDPVSVGVACHLTNTVFIDRALILVPVEDGKIPDESHAMQLAAPGGTVAGVLPTASNWPSNVVNQVTGTGTGQVIMTHDPRLTTMGISQYPPLPATMDATKIDEIRRTVFVDNLDPAVTGEQLMQFFTQVGEVKYIRMAGDDSSSKSAYVEFTNQTSVPTAFTYNGVNCGTKPIRVSHSTVAIVKPMPKLEIPSKEVEEAMKKVKEAQSLISGAVESGMKENISKPMKPEYRHDRRPKSRSPMRSRRKRSHSKSRRSRSRSRRRSRSKGRSRSKRRSRSRGRRSRSRSKSHSRRRSRSPKRRRSRSRSKHRRRSRTPPRGYRSSRKSASRERSRRRSGSRSRRRSRSGSPPLRKRKPVSRSPSPPILEKESLSPRRSKSRSKTPKLTRKPKRSKSRSPRRRSRSRDRRRSRSRTRHIKKEKKRDRDRSRERSSKSKKDSKINIKRDYDEEEKGYSSGPEEAKVDTAVVKLEAEVKEEVLDETKDNLEQEDMDMDSD